MSSSSPPPLSANIMSEFPDVWYQINGRRQQRFQEFSGRYVDDLMKAIKKEEQLDQSSSILVPYVKHLDADEIELTETLLINRKGFGNLIKQYGIDSENPIRVRLPDATPQAPHEPDTKRRRLEREPSAWSLQTIEDAKILAQLINNMAPEVTNHYSNSAKTLNLPFPFVGQPPSNRFKIVEKVFEYTGREKFIDVEERIRELKKEGHRALAIYGTIGYGKSHILAAMACYLIRRKYRVVYLPDCRTMIQNPVEYLKLALCLTFADDDDLLHQIALCDMSTIADFCRNIAPRFTMYFIVDQMNALDGEEGAKDEFSNNKKDKCRDIFWEVTYDHYRITSASANVKARITMNDKQKNYLSLDFYGGLTKMEMKNWWTLREEDLPKMDENEKANVEDITGCIPLLLRALMEYPLKSFKDIETAFMKSADMIAVPYQVEKFVIGVRAKLRLAQIEWNEFANKMDRFLVQQNVPESPDDYDHRYFYIRDNVGYYTCGLARDTMAVVLRSFGNDYFLGDMWFNAVKSFSTNATVLGFLVEQMCISSIAQSGLKVVDRSYHPQKIIVFDGGDIRFLEELKCTLYIPKAFNYAAIDALLIDLDANEGPVVIAIQTTIAKRHSDSVAKFMNGWRDLAKQFEEYDQVNIFFVWITENTRSIVVQHSQTVLETRNDSFIRPAFIEQSVTVMDVNNDIGKALKIARRRLLQ